MKYSDVPLHNACNILRQFQTSCIQGILLLILTVLFERLYPVVGSRILKNVFVKQFALIMIK